MKCYLKYYTMYDLINYARQWKIIFNLTLINVLGYGMHKLPSYDLTIYILWVLHGDCNLRGIILFVGIICMSVGQLSSSRPHAIRCSLITSRASSMTSFPPLEALPCRVANGLGETLQGKIRYVVIISQEGPKMLHLWSRYIS